MNVALSVFDVLSLYTEVDENEGLVKRTRSVILHQPTEDKTIFLIDNIPFYLFISIPTDVDIVALRKFMINSYSFSHYNSPYNTSEYGDRKEKGMAVEEQSNIMIDTNIKEMLQLIDERNDILFADFISKSRKKKKKYNDDKSDEESSIEEEEEDDKEEEEECMFTGLEKESVPLIMSHVNKGQAFPGNNQYRLTFNNHCILSHFINRFKREIAPRDGSSPYNVDVIAYTMVNGSQPKPTDKLFKGRASEYIDGQLYAFKDKHDKVALRFPTTRTITYGLLMPSCCDGDKNTSRQQVPNLFENIQNAKKSQYRGKTIAYQTLYVDLYERKDKHTIFVVDYTTRQLLEKSSLKPVEPKKKRSLPADKPLRKQPAIGNFFPPTKKARIEEEKPVNQ